MDLRMEADIQDAVDKLVADLKEKYRDKDGKRAICHALLRAIVPIHHVEVCECREQGCVQLITTQGIATMDQQESAHMRRNKLVDTLKDAISKKTPGGDGASLNRLPPASSSN